MANILVIDDDERVRFVMRESLLAMGHTVIEAEDAASGFTLAVQQKPDLILSDFMMPMAPGKNLFQDLSSDPQTKNVPILIMSGLPKAKIQGFIPAHLWMNILTKPVDYSQLKDCIENILKQHKPPLIDRP